MSRRARLRLTGALSLIALCSTGCAQQGATVQGQDIHKLYVVITLLAAPVFVVVEALLLYIALRYRKRARDEATPPQQHGGTRTLVVFFAIPTVIVAALYYFGETTLAKVQKQDPSPVVTIRAEGFQWEWTFYYLNEGFFTSGKTLVKPALMVIPVDEPIRIQLESRDVIHSFFISAFLFKRDVIPGRHNSFTFTANKLGNFPAQCAEFCGLYHSKMTFMVRVVNPVDYNTWVKEQKEAALNVSCPSTGTAVTVTAKDISWNTNCLSVAAMQPIGLTVANQDEAIDHNFAIYKDSSERDELFMTGRFPGVATNAYTIPPLPPGKYYFQCDVHGPAMSGTYIVNKP